MIGTRQERASLQSDFFRDKYHKVLHALFVSIVVILLLVIAIIYVVLTKPAPRYYASSTDGQVIVMSASR